ncbi:MAG: hypothetical protein U5L09_16835 [Bacteroidales bacterium]|nr:hypothetical protein [Bacteroidales bacterium]
MSSSKNTGSVNKVDFIKLTGAKGKVPKPAKPTKENLSSHIKEPNPSSDRKRTINF